MLLLLLLLLLFEFSQFGKSCSFCTLLTFLLSDWISGTVRPRRAWRGSLRVSSEGPCPQWVASDGIGRIDMLLEPRHPVDVFVAPKAGSVKMKVVAAASP